MNTQTNHDILQKQLKGALEPINPLLQDPAISDIYIDGSTDIYVKLRNGRMERKRKITLPSPQHLHSLASLLARRSNAELNLDSPFLDTVYDGQRFNIAIAPIYTPGTCITIRKSPQKPLSAAHLMRAQTFDLPGLHLLKSAIRAKKRILVAGETGSGKTTLLSALCQFIPRQSGRVITIEDTAELNFDHPFRVPLLSRTTPNHRAQSFTQILINALRMDPDWLIIGEIRGPEALTLIYSFICHPGLATIHARGTTEALTRLKTLICAHSNLPNPLATENVHQAIDLIIHIQNHPDNHRRITQITEIPPNPNQPPIPLYTYDPKTTTFKTLNNPSFETHPNPTEVTP